MPELRMFVPITKVDVAKREVWGRLTQEVPDHANEILDYASSKPLFQAWSAEFEKVTNGQSLGNLRAMHGKVAAGKLVALDLNDVEKAVDIGAKVVDDNEWEKVQEGVYTGFSVGGSYAKTWPDPEQKGLTRFTAQPGEASLVDSPCVPTARFAVVKADGTSEQRAFKAAVEDPEEPRGLLRKLADAITKIAERKDTSAGEGKSKYGDVTFADETNKKYPIDTKAHAKAAWNYINKPKNAAKYSAGDLKTIKGKIKAAAKKFGVEIAEQKKDAAKLALADALRKGMYGVSTLAQLLTQVEYCAQDAEWEADFEGDDSDLPMRLHVWLVDGLDILLEMVSEETSEMAEKHGGELAAAAPIGGLAKMHTLQALHDLTTDMGAGCDKALAPGDLAKATSRDDRLQAIHDHASAMGAECDEEEDMGKIATEVKETLAKMEGALEKLTESNTKLAGENADLKKRLEAVEALPAPGKAVLHPVGKAEDLGGKAVEKIDPAKVEKNDREGVLALIKQVQAETGSLADR
jgi:hypothetical protein